jgi:tol-pal system protein YbgF
MRRLFAAAAALLLLPLGACTSQEDMALLHREITDVQRQVQQLRQATLDKSDLAPMEQRMQEQTEKVLRSNADLAVRVRKLQERIESLQANLEVTTRQLEKISQELAAGSRLQRGAAIPPVTTAPAAGQAASQPAGGAPAAPAAAGTPTPQPSTPQGLYQSAYQDYLNGNYDLAIQGFQEYLKRYPKTDLADNALYWIGECYDAQGKEQEALQAFSSVLEKYPTSDKGAAAQLKKGLVYLKLGNQGQGVVNLQYVVYEHPGTKEADLAREKLRSLGITIR